jgi:hypothetical protein
VANFYARLATTATRLLDDKGQTLSFSRDNVTSFNPVTGEETKGTAITYSGSGAVFGYGSSEINGTDIQRDDRRVILEAVSTAPAVGDSVTIDSIVHRVVDVEQVNPAGTVVIYQLQVRV